MRRRLELLRDILLRCEAEERSRFTFTETWINAGGWPEDQSPIGEDGSRRWSDEELYHIDLLRDAGFVAFEEVTDAPWLGNPEFEPVKETMLRLTHSGHDYLDAIRDRGIWERTKEAVEQSGGSMTLELVKAIAIGYAKKQLEGRTGITL